MPMNINIQPIKIGDEHYVAVVIGGSEMERRGPFSDADEAESVARRLLQFGRALTSSGGKRG
jgi:hypothetical protein